MFLQYGYEIPFPATEPKSEDADQLRAEVVRLERSLNLEALKYREAELNQLRAQLEDAEAALAFYQRQGAFHPYDGGHLIDDYGQRAWECLERLRAGRNRGES